MNQTILVINPGSTSDEISLFQNGKEIFHKTVRYSTQEMAPYEGQKVTVQYELRKTLVQKTLQEQGIDPKTLTAIIGRGGLVKPIPSGIYRVNSALLRDLEEGLMGDHPSNLGGLIAHSLAEPLHIPSFIADPVVVDEMCTLARYSGMPENPRLSIFHALNQKRVGRLTAQNLGKKYEECNLIVAHAGGGISVGAHQKGQVIDVNNALDGDGPMTPQRSGGVPAGGVAKMSFSQKYTHSEMKLKFKGKGGLVAYTGTSDMQGLQKWIQTGEISEDLKSQLKPGFTKEMAKEVIDAMVYQIAKEIGGLAAILKGKVDAIAFTGGLAYQTDLVVNPLKEYTSFIAPLHVFPGGDEMAALHEACLRVMKNEEQAKDYQG